MSLKTLENSNKIYTLRILSKELINHDVLKLVIELPSNNHVLGTRSGEHFFIVAQINKQEVWRKYTPVNLEDQKGKFETIIKVYRKNDHKNYPKGGVMTQYLESLNPGDSINIQGPIGRCTYLHNGLFELRYEKFSSKTTRNVKYLGMVAGGSGIAPFLQLANTICNDPNDSTKIHMIFANHTENDIICREELDFYQNKYPDKFKIWYTITKSIKPNWNYSIGYINKEMFLKHLPPPGKDTLIMICGPKEFVWSTGIPTLEAIGYKKDMIFRY